MLKKSKKYLRGKNWRYLKISPVVIVLVIIIGSFFLAIFLANDISHTPSSPQIKEFADKHRLVSIPAKGMFGGVLAGFAYYLVFPLWLLRVLSIFSVLALDDIGINKFIILAYILCWIFMPAIDFIPADFVARTD